MRILGLILFIVLVVSPGRAAQAQDAAADQTHRRLVAVNALIADGQRRRAEALLAHMIRTAPSGRAAAPYAALLARSHRDRPFQLQGGLGLLPSTNVNRAATATTFSTLAGDFTIDDGGEARSGVGLNVSLGAAYRLPLDGSRTFQVTGKVGRTLYEEDTLRYWTGHARAEMIDRQPRQTLRYGAFVSRSVYDADTDSPADSPDAWRLGVNAQWSRDHDGISRTISGRFEYRDYVEQDARDGPFAQVAALWATPLGARGRLHWGVGLERHLPELAYQRNWGASARVGYTHKVTGTIRLGGTLSATLRRFDADFATVDFARADDIYRIGLAASDTRIRIAGAVPALSCGYTDHRSSIALYETSYTDCSVTFSLGF